MHPLTYLYIAVWGLIWVAGGLAVQVPQWGRWTAIVCVGLPFLIIGAAGLVLRARSPLAGLDAQMDQSELRLMLLLGIILLAGGLLGAVYAWTTYEIKAWELEAHRYREAPWMKWVFVAALVWAGLGGLGMSVAALGAMPRQNG